MKNHRTLRLLPLLIPAFFSAASANTRAGDLDRYKVQREEVFEFAQKPIVTRNGDKVTVTFETRGLCDVAIAVEDAGGRILCHVVSGVLGRNAPEPLQKNSKKQTVTWDGKNDAGAYVDNKDGVTIRVSLGLKPRFERNLFHSPYKLWGRNQPIFAPAPEGVYVFEGDNADSVKLFDHDGNYIRTVYPFPAGKISQVKGLRWRQAPQDGAKVPFKEGFYQSTFFNSGYNSGYATGGYGTTHFPTLGMYWAEDAPNFPAATAFTVHGHFMALAGTLGINRMATDGSGGGTEFIGPRTSLTATERIFGGELRPVQVAPRSAALSPDGKWLYMTGYTWPYETTHYGGRQWLHGVLRAACEGQAAPEVFVGSANPAPSEAGNSPDKLYAPVAVACDEQGYVYVADYGNNRIQVFNPEAKLKESIPVNRPANLVVHPKTGDLYVFSWLIKWDSTAAAAPDKAGKVDAALIRLGPPGKRQEIARYPITWFNGYTGKFGLYFELGGIQYRAQLDPWTDPPRVWLAPGAAVTSGNYGVKSFFWTQTAIKILVLDKDRLTLKKDFGKETLRTTVRDARSGNGRQLLTVNPKTGKLYVFEPSIKSDQAVEIDPETGKEKLFNLPHGADEMAFDLEGMLYLRTATLVTRFDPRDNREIPWDYGEERKSVGGGHGARAANVISGLVLPGAHPSEPSLTCCGGFGISPRGNVAAQCWNGESFAKKTSLKEKKQGVGEITQAYIPKVYPGRQRWGEIHVWDKHGKLLHKDAAPGVTITDGVTMDDQDNIYVLTNPAHTPDGKRVLNPKSETLIKFKPGKGKIITSGAQIITGQEGIKIPVPLDKAAEPKGPTQLAGTHQAAAWVQGAEWLYGGVGFSSGGDTCWNARCALDLYARTFAPEPDRFSVAVLDTNGNLIMRIGRYGNIDDGTPLTRHPTLVTRPLGGDEVALMHACYTGVQSDKRLFVSDAGNRRIISIKLGYNTEERIALKTVQDQGLK